MQSWQARIATLVFLPLAALVGCNDSPYSVAPASGVVLIDGRPFSAGKVMFTPTAKNGIEGGKAAFGVLDEQGRFELSTYRQGDGAVVGEHWVMLYSMDERRTSAHNNVPKFRRVPVVRKPIKVNAEGDNSFEFDLSSAEF